MEQKLIKINEQHYIVIDDSEIREEDSKSYLYHPKEKVVFISYIKGQSCLSNQKMFDFFKGSLRKITYSTQPLYKNDFWVTKELKLSEVEEAIKDNPSENNEWNVYFDDNNKIVIMNV